MFLNSDGVERNELAGFLKGDQGSRGSGLVLDYLTIQAQLQTSASSESEEHLPVSGHGFMSVSLEIGRKKDCKHILLSSRVVAFLT